MWFLIVAAFALAVMAGLRAAVRRERKRPPAPSDDAYPLW